MLLKEILSMNNNSQFYKARTLTFSCTWVSIGKLLKYCIYRRLPASICLYSRTNLAIADNLEFTVYMNIECEYEYED